MSVRASQTIWIKPIGGIAGDMFVGAAAALWPGLKEDCLSDLAALDMPAGVDAAFETVSVNGFAAQKFRVATDGAAPPSGDYAAIAARLTKSRLAAPVRETALAILKRLGDAEAAIHGVPLDRVHFHELADWDSLADITAAASFIARAPEAEWRVGALPLGGGFIDTQHGRVAAPAPATLRLLQGFDFVDDGVLGERVTPTGAALVAHLARPGGRGPVGKLIGAGFGAGDRRMTGIANVTQLVQFARAATPDADRVAEIAFDIDDMTGEEMAVAADRLRAMAGMKDLTQTAQIGKKGRPSTLFRLLAAPDAAEALIAAVFRETSTLGVRVNETERRILPRREAVAGAVKLAQRPGGDATAKAESDGIAALPGLADRRGRARALEETALAEVSDDG